MSGKVQEWCQKAGMDLAEFYVTYNQFLSIDNQLQWHSRRFTMNDNY